MSLRDQSAGSADPTGQAMGEKAQRQVAREAGGEAADLRILATQVDGIADRLAGDVEDQITLRRAATELRIYDASLPAVAERDEARRELAEAVEKADRWVATANAYNDDAERLTAQRDELVKALRGVAVQYCREWCEDKQNYCYAEAEFVLWGKLLKPEALGPRCYDHAAKHVGHHALYPKANYALIDLRPARSALASTEDR